MSETISTEETMILKEELHSVRKAEWGVILALTINVVTAAFGVGVYFNTITEQGRRIAELESDRNMDRKTIADLSNTLVKIDANVEFLKQRAQEDRQIIYQRRGL